MKNITKQELKQKISEYKKKIGLEGFVRWNGGLLFKWEYQLLKDIGAISDLGIVANYPIIKYEKEDGSTKNEDLGGDLFEITKRVNDFNMNVGAGAKVKAKISYYPKAFIIYKEIENEKDLAFIAERAKLRQLTKNL